MYNRIMIEEESDKKLPKEFKLPASLTGKADLRTDGRCWKAMPEFLQKLSEYGNVSQAAKSLDINPVYLYKLRREFPELKVIWDRAARIGAKALEDEARRRAYEGVNKPVFHEGEVCGHIRQYSDTLLIFLLKAHFPEKYRENVSITGPGGGPLELNVRVSYVKPGGKTYDQDGNEIPPATP